MHAGDEARSAPARTPKLLEIGDMNDPPAPLELPLQPNGGSPHDDVSSYFNDVQGKSAGVVIRDPQKALRREEPLDMLA